MPIFIIVHEAESHARSKDLQADLPSALSVGYHRQGIGTRPFNTDHPSSFIVQNEEVARK